MPLLSYFYVSLKEKVQLNESDSTDSDGELLRSTTRHQQLEAGRHVIIHGERSYSEQRLRCYLTTQNKLRLS